MDGATRSLVDLWGVTEAAAQDLEPEDWARPTPGDGMDVTDLVVHLAGASYTGPDQLVPALRAARAHATARLAASAPSPRTLAAQCLDMCLHAHDLTSALGDPVDLAGYEPAALAACRLVVDVAPRLLVASLDARDATVRLVARGSGGAVVERTVHVVDGRLAATADPTVRTDIVEVDAGALLLLLAGRLDADALAAAGAARWSGPAADAFVHGARLTR